MFLLKAYNREHQALHALVFNASRGVVQVIHTICPFVCFVNMHAWDRPANAFLVEDADRTRTGASKLLNDIGYGNVSEVMEIRVLKKYVALVLFTFCHVAV